MSRRRSRAAQPVAAAKPEPANRHDQYVYFPWSSDEYHEFSIRVKKIANTLGLEMSKSFPLFPSAPPGVVLDGMVRLNCVANVVRAMVECKRRNVPCIPMAGYIVTKFPETLHEREELCGYAHMVLFCLSDRKLYDVTPSMGNSRVFERRPLLFFRDERAIGGMLPRVFFKFCLLEGVRPRLGKICSDKVRFNVQMCEGGQGHALLIDLPGKPELRVAVNPNAWAFDESNVLRTDDGVVGADAKTGWPIIRIGAIWSQVLNRLGKGLSCSRCEKAWNQCLFSEKQCKNPASTRVCMSCVDRSRYPA